MSTAIHWAVYPALSTQAMIAAGVTDQPAAARSVVEAVMTGAQNAGWGEIVRIALPGASPASAEPGEWPPPGEVHVCRRDRRDGEYKWMPLFP